MVDRDGAAVEHDTVAGDGVHLGRAILAGASRRAVEDRVQKVGRLGNAHNELPYFFGVVSRGRFVGLGAHYDIPLMMEVCR